MARDLTPPDGLIAARNPEAAPPEREGSDVRSITPWMLRGFHMIARRRLARAFRAVRVAHAERAQELAQDALVVVLNHPSWWDPLMGFVLARHLFGPRNFYAPMDAEALQRYAIFKRLGMFPIAMGSPRGAAQFLRAGQAVLEGGHVLAVTAQGHFTDVRERPVRLRPGLAALLQRRSQRGLTTHVLPIALEYTFWDQRLPEALALCGEPLRFTAAAIADRGSNSARSHLQSALELGLQGAQDELAQLALRREPQHFSTVIEGSRGSAGWYAWIERLQARLQGKAAPRDHTASTPPLR